MSRSIYIGGLPDSVGQDDIHKHLEIYGKITAIYIYPGYGFVEFESDADAKDAVARLKNQPFLGYDMTIQLAKNQRGGEKGSPKPTVRERGRSQTSDGYVEFQPKKRYPVTVYNLDRQTCWQELKDFGRLAGGTVVFCQVDKINRGRGLIEYISQEDANHAVKELNGRVLHGKALSLYIHPDRRPYDHFKRVSPAKSPETQQRYEPYPSSRSRQSTAESSTSAGSRIRTKTNDQNLSPVKRVAVETHSPLRQRDCFPTIHAKDGYGDAYSRPQYHRDEYWEWDRRAGEEYHRAWDREYYC